MSTGRETQPAPEIDAERAAIKRERLRRDSFFEEARSFTPYVAAVVGEEVFFVETSDPRIGKDVFVRRKRSDMHILGVAVTRLAEYGPPLPEEPVFVDVGANIGTTTVAALRRHGFGAGVAVEPSPTTFRTLRLNLVVNGLDRRVQALQVAAGAEEGAATLDTSRDPGRHRLAEAEYGGGEVVDVVTLDALARRGVVDRDRVGLLWIDAQGYEASVLAGAGSLLEAGVAVVATIRRKAPWPEGLVEQLLGTYTDVIELRKRPDGHRRPQRIDELPRIISSLPRIQDVLLFRR